MKLLIVTQVVDTEDPGLGFFVRWIEEFAKQVERIEVICLKEGKHMLPVNVRVHSLGKEKGMSRREYVLNFYRYIWRLRHDYDVVFVHMNQEYILLAGWFWKLYRKQMYLWRNHYAGSWLTDTAALFCTKIFCTSKHSYTAKYKKTVLMPVGLDTELFFPSSRVACTSRSILFLARMAPSKRPEVLIEALGLLSIEGQNFSALFIGSPLPQDEGYYENLKEKVRKLELADRIRFLPGIPKSQAPDLYRAHEIFVNASPSGMFDKTIFEAAACGCLPLTSNQNLIGLFDEGLLFKEGDSKDLKQKLVSLVGMTEEKKQVTRAELQKFVNEHHSLELLGKKLIKSLDNLTSV